MGGGGRGVIRGVVVKGGGQGWVEVGVVSSGVPDEAVGAPRDGGAPGALVHTGQQNPA